MELANMRIQIGDVTIVLERSRDLTLSVAREPRVTVPARCVPSLIAAVDIAAKQLEPSRLEAFLVVWKDRHTDDAFHLRETLAGANAKLDEIAAEYTRDDAECRFEERSYGRPVWVRYLESMGGDGPRGYIQKIRIGE